MDANPAEDQRDRQEAVRIRLEDMLAHADSRSVRVLQLALQKCNSKLDMLAESMRQVDEARQRMRVIESKHFQGARASTNVAPELRALHIRREGTATLVDHIQCTLYDQVRIHYLLTELAGRLSSLKQLLFSMDRADRVVKENAADRPDSSGGPLTPQRHTVQTEARRQGFARRVSKGAFRNMGEESIMADRLPNRGPSLRSQRSLTRRSEGKRIPHVVKRALSYSTPSTPPNGYVAPPLEQGRDATWWREHAAALKASGRSEPRLNMWNIQIGRTRSMRSHGGSIESSGSLRGSVDRGKERRTDDYDYGEEDLYGGSPVSVAAGERAGSPTYSKYGMRRSARATPKPRGSLEQSVLVDIDSLCTEASSVLSSSRGLDSDTSMRRGSISSAVLHISNTSKRGRGFGRLRMGRLRTGGQVKKLWLEINEMYKIVLTHAPHLVEEKIVARATMDSGVLGAWNAKKSKMASVRISFQTSIVVEAVRKVNTILAWQRQLIVAIRRDLYEQRRALRNADVLISGEYLQALNAGQVKKS